MTIKENLRIFCKEIFPNEELDRAIDIVSRYYGLIDSDLYTLEEIGEIYGLTREGVRQIKKKFLAKAKLYLIEPFRVCKNLIISEKVHQGEKLKNSFVDHGLFENNLFSLRGFFDLMLDMGIITDYNIYGHESNQITRINSKPSNETYVVRKDYIGRVRKIRKILYNIQNQYGIANINYTISILNLSESEIDIAKHWIKSNPKFWISNDSKIGFWYSLENKENRLIKYCGEIFFVLESGEIDLSILSSQLLRALKFKSSKDAYPSGDIINSYLCESKNFYVKEEKIFFAGEKRELTKIDKDIFHFLKNNQEVTFDVLEKHLKGKGHKTDLIRKSVYNSSIVLVKDAEIKKSRFSLIGNHIDKLLVDDRYLLFMGKLKQLYDGNTDSKADIFTRNEQQILKEWLFKDKRSANCAICNRRFNISSLVTAHKKKRITCTNEERLDPYVVMPLCKFGCDYLYENGIIYILDGVIKFNEEKIDEDSTEYEIAHLLSGKKLNDEWLKGNADYFKKR